MGFSFNPLLWFVCNSCKEAFPNTDELMEHKLMQHLSDCLQIKCIVFEEKFVHKTWTPANRIFSTRPSNKQSLPPKNNQPIERIQRFQNPYVSLTKLPLATSSTLSRKRKTNFTQRSHDLSEESPPSKSQRCVTPSNDIEETYQNFKIETVDRVPMPILTPKKESHSTFKAEEDTLGDLGFEFDPARDSDSTEEPEDCNPPVVALTACSLDPETKATFHAEVKQPSSNHFKSAPAPEPEEGEESRSELEPESVSGSEWEGESDSDFESRNPEKSFTNTSQKQKINEKQKESSTTLFSCSTCSKTFPTIHILKNHRIIHRKTKSFRCSHKRCLSSFDTQKNLKSHLKQHEKRPGIDLNEDFDHNSASEFSPDLPLLQWMLLQEEKNPTNSILLEPDPKSGEEFQPVSKTNPVTCKFCKELFVSEIDLRWHVSKCFLFNKRWHRYCPQCDQSFPNAKAFKRHIRSKHSTVPRPIFKCSVCSKEFKRENICKFHESTHELPIPKEFESDGDVGKKEVEDQGKKSTYFQCQSCDKSFMAACFLKYHQRIHTGERPFKCDVGNCDKAFVMKASLVRHQQSSHIEELGLSGHLCPVCGKKYCNEKSLRQHINRVHDNSNFLKCTFDDTCSHVCKNKVQMIEHVRIVHTGEKPFQCDQCGESFVRKRTLVRHIKQTHEGFRHQKVPCPLCPRMLKGNYELKKHMETHKGGKNFECKVCGYITASLNYLSRHEKIHGKGAAIESRSNKGKDTDTDNVGDDLLTGLLCL